MASDLMRIKMAKLIAGDYSRQGSVLDGISTALFQEITLDKGATVQGNFNDYRLMRISEAPQVEVKFL